MKKITLNSDKENLTVLNDFMNDYLKDYEISHKIIIQLELAVEEIFVNICSYAFDSANENICVCFDVLQNPLTLQITFEDSGKPYNPLMRSDPDITLDAEKRKVGGLGVFIVKQVMDDCDYKFENSKNIFTVKKRLISD